MIMMITNQEICCVMRYSIFQTTGHHFYPSLTEVTNIFLPEQYQHNISSEYVVKIYGLQDSANFSECRYLMTWNENWNETLQFHLNG